MELDTYVALHELWGTCIPTFIVVGKVGFWHAIVLQDLKVKFPYIFAPLEG